MSFVIFTKFSDFSKLALMNFQNLVGCMIKNMIENVTTNICTVQTHFGESTYEST